MDDYDYDYDLGEFYDDGRYDDDPNPYHGTYSEEQSTNSLACMVIVAQTGRASGCEPDC